MKDPANYSNYVSSSYLAAGLIIAALTAYIVMKYFTAKAKVKNEK